MSSTTNTIFTGLLFEMPLVNSYDSFVNKVNVDIAEMVIFRQVFFGYYFYNTITNPTLYLTII